MNDETKATVILKTANPRNFTIPDEDINNVQCRWEKIFTILGLFTQDKDSSINAFNTLSRDNLQQTQCLTHPPVLPSILWLMIVMELRDKDTITRLFDNIFQYQKWFVENRDPYKKGIISIFHPWETGREFSPDWTDALNNINLDKPYIRNPHLEDMRYLMIIEKMCELEWDNKKIYDEGIFNICDPTVQFIFVRSCKDLYKIAYYLNRTETYKTLDNWIDLYSFGSNYLWNTKLNAYSSLNLKTGQLFNGISCGSMLYAYADVGNNEQKESMYSHSKRILYYSNYGFPHCYSNKGDLQVKKYWKGPIWCIMNFMLVLGFKQGNQIYLSDKIKKNMKHIIEKNGFFEFINPDTGLCIGETKNYETAAIYLLFTTSTLE